MLLVEVNVTLDSDHRLTDDEITDLIEELVEDLDHLPVEPSVGTRRIDDNIELIVGVTVDKDEEFGALVFGVGIIKAAFQATATAQLVSHDLRSRVLPLQAA